MLDILIKANKEYTLTMSPVLTEYYIKKDGKVIVTFIDKGKAFNTFKKKYGKRCTICGSWHIQQMLTSEMEECLACGYILGNFPTGLIALI